MKLKHAVKPYNHVIASTFAAVCVPFEIRHIRFDQKCNELLTAQNSTQHEIGTSQDALRNPPSFYGDTFFIEIKQKCAFLLFPKRGYETSRWERAHVDLQYNFMETPRTFIIAELSIRKLGFSSVLIIMLLLIILLIIIINIINNNDIIINNNNVIIILSSLLALMKIRACGS